MCPQSATRPPDESFLLMLPCLELVLNSQLSFIASIVLSRRDYDFDENLLVVVIFNKTQACHMSSDRKKM